MMLSVAHTDFLKGEGGEGQARSQEFEKVDKNQSKTMLIANWR